MVSIVQKLTDPKKILEVIHTFFTFQSHHELHGSVSAAVAKLAGEVVQKHLVSVLTKKASFRRRETAETGIPCRSVGGRGGAAKATFSPHGGGAAAKTTLWSLCAARAEAALNHGTETPLLRHGAAEAALFSRGWGVGKLPGRGDQQTQGINRMRRHLIKKNYNKTKTKQETRFE